MSEFHIVLTREQCAHLIDNSRPNPRSKTAHLLPSGYLSIFGSAVAKAEQRDVVFTSPNAVMNPKTNRHGVCFLRITAYCAKCHRIDKKGLFTMTLDQRPYDNEQLVEYAMVKVVRQQVHRHERNNNHREERARTPPASEEQASSISDEQSSSISDEQSSSMSEAPTKQRISRTLSSSLYSLHPLKTSERSTCSSNGLSPSKEASTSSSRAIPAHRQRLVVGDHALRLRQFRQFS